MRLPVINEKQTHDMNEWIPIVAIAKVNFLLFPPDKLPATLFSKSLRSSCQHTRKGVSVRTQSNSEHEVF